jgi:rhamnosyltransferase
VTAEERPRLLVLLAAYNGRAFIGEQLTSILGQDQVDVEVLVSVDVSGDGTEAIVSELAASEPRVRHLPHGQRFGGAAPNFYRLMSEADLAGFTHVALADQDDVWFLDKLARATDQLRLQSASCYSSNVLAWFDDGHARLLDKAQPQRTWDHLFSSAGPGCTYVFTSAAMADFVRWLREHQDRVASVAYHDWLLYAWMRTHGQRWYIDPQPTMRYRQHAANQLGANSGIKAALVRVRGIQNDWFKCQVLAISGLLGCEEERPIILLTKSTTSALLRLLGLSAELRRSRREALAMCGFILARSLLPRRWGS